MTREEKAQYCMDNPKKSPAFQFYPGDWFGSGHVSMMSISERGVHATLLFSAWPQENCGIPENEIIPFARITSEEKPIALKVLQLCWFLYAGFWFNERLLNERIKQIKIGFKREFSGSKGGRPRKSKISKSKPIDNQMKAKESKSEYINENEIEDIKEKRVEEKKEKYLDYVFLKKSEYDRLLKEYGKRFLDRCLFVLDEWFSNGGSNRRDKYSDHNKCIRKWVIQAVKKEGYSPEPFQEKKTEEIILPQTDEEKAQAEAAMKEIHRLASGIGKHVV